MPLCPKFCLNRPRAAAGAAERRGFHLGIGGVIECAGFFMFFDNGLNSLTQIILRRIIVGEFRIKPHGAAQTVLQHPAQGKFGSGITA